MFPPHVCLDSIFREWIENAPPENILRVIMCLRIFMRDPEYQSTFADLGGIKVLARVSELFPFGSEAVLI